MPGPAAYNSTPEKFKEKSSPSYKIGRAQREMKQYGKLFPGPGAYDINKKVYRTEISNRPHLLHMSFVVKMRLKTNLSSSFPDQGITLRV